ncbi:MAG TPA: AbrB/MazE/SpoVT family DNA-binding domain-containing protein [Desulfobacterales bacterium]|nr:AbrB/MazE/SpoVT family DNA-binding domain-containing protein [Desulfobacterales bacterium]
MAGLVVETRVGRKGAIYIPKSIMQVLGVKEGDKVIIRVEDGRLVLEFIPDPFTLAVDIRAWAETSVEEFEKESEEEQVAWED